MSFYLVISLLWTCSLSLPQPSIHTILTSCASYTWVGGFFLMHFKSALGLMSWQVSYVHVYSTGALVLIHFPSSVRD